MKRRKIRRKMSEKRLLKLKRQLRKRAKKLRLGKKRTGAYVYGTLRRVRGNQMRSSFDKPVFGPGNVETRIVRTDTLTGIKEAERLVRDGWYQGHVGLFTTTYYRKRRATPQVAPAWKTGIYTGRGIARNPGFDPASIINKESIKREYLAGYKSGMDSRIQYGAGLYGSIIKDQEKKNERYLTNVAFGVERNDNTKFFAMKFAYHLGWRRGWNGDEPNSKYLPKKLT